MPKKARWRLHKSELPSGRVVDPLTKRGVLYFDLDGTLADSGAGIHAALNEVFSGYGHEVLSIDELHSVIGPPLEESLPRIFEPRDISNDLVQTFILDYRAVYKEKHLPNTVFNAGMEEALEALSLHWHLAVVTAKPETQAVVAVEALRSTHRFITVVGPEGDSPHPKSLLLRRAMAEVTEHLGHSYDSKTCWMIGDRHHDIDAGISMGTMAMGVLWGFGSVEELSTAGAHVIADTPADLLKTLLT
jgi:phosphoglycolate phosphatase